MEKSGSWYSYDGSRIGQGREAAKTFLTENTDIADKIEKAIRANAGQIGQNLVLDASEKAEAKTKNRPQGSDHKLDRGSQPWRLNSSAEGAPVKGAPSVFARWPGCKSQA